MAWQGRFYRIVIQRRQRMDNGDFIEQMEEEV
jgi:hypothetical protein